LKRSFPNIQFVCTSHSPQVIGEIRREEIRVLQDGGAFPPAVGYGADSNWILEHVMHAEPRTEEAAAGIRAVENVLDEGNLDGARRELERLRGVVQGEDGEIARLDASIRNMEALAHEED
jgi:predicted ATP-binding protein involved in virulence